MAKEKTMELQENNESHSPTSNCYRKRDIRATVPLKKCALMHWGLGLVPFLLFALGGTVSIKTE